MKKSDLSELFQRLIFKLFVKKYMRQEDDFYIGYSVRCLQCGKLYIPSDIMKKDPFNISKILINNWCSRKCYDKTGGFKSWVKNVMFLILNIRNLIMKL